MEYALLFLILCATFWRALLCGYCVDDDVRMKQLKEYREKGWPGVYNIWGKINHCLYGAGIFDHPFKEHIFTTLLHYVNCCLIYWVSGNFMASVLYMVCPAFNQTSIWLNGRRYAVVIFLILLGWKFKTILLPAYVAALGIHVSALAFPLLLLWTKWWWAVPLVAGIGLVLMWKEIKIKHDNRRKDFKSGHEGQILRPKKIIIYIKHLGFYFFHTIFPFKPRMYHEFMYYFTRYEWSNKEGYSLNFHFWRGIVVVAFVSYEIILQHNFWMFWWLIFISQWCGVYTVTQTVADRYCSLSGIGLMVTLSIYIAILPSPYMEMVYTAFIIFYLLKYWPLFDAYKSIDYFHQYHIALQPDGVESRSLKATRHLMIRDPHTAFAIIKEGLRYRPNDFKLLIVMIQCLYALRKPEAALKVLIKARENIPLDDQADAVVLDGIEETIKRLFPQEVRDPIDVMTNDKILAEYEKIKNRESTLSSSQRKKILEKYYHITRIRS